MSVGHQRLIVNCGVPAPERHLAPPPGAHHRRPLDRHPQRHLVLPLPHPHHHRRLAGRGHRRRPDAHRRRAPATSPARTVAGHAPQRLCRALPHRPRAPALSLSDAGDRLEGVDTFVSPSGSRSTRAARTPSPSASTSTPTCAPRAEAATPSLLELPDGESWEFETDAAELVIEESILMSDTRGNRATEQLVIYGRIQQTPSVTWHLHRTALGGRRQRLIAAARPRPPLGAAAPARAAPRPRFIAPAIRDMRPRTPARSSRSAMAIKPASDAASRPRAAPPRAALRLRQDRPRRFRPGARRAAASS